MPMKAISMASSARDAIRAHLAQPPAEPLTDEQITEIYHRKSELRGWRFDVALKFARDLERAHGIT